MRHNRNSYTPLEAFTHTQDMQPKSVSFPYLTDVGANFSGTDFSNYPMGRFPMKWTFTKNPAEAFQSTANCRIVPGGAISDRCLEISNLTGTLVDLYWTENPPAVATNQEILTLVEIVSHPAPAGYAVIIGIILKHEGIFGVSTSAIIRGLGYSTTNAKCINRLTYFGGSFTRGVTAFTWNTGTKYWIRYRIVGASILRTVWEFGTAEPAGVADSTNTFTSYPGLFFNLVGAVTRCHFYATSTNSASPIPLP